MATVKTTLLITFIVFLIAIIWGNDSSPAAKRCHSKGGSYNFLNLDSKWACSRLDIIAIPNT